MENAEQILVIFLSTTLAILLVLSIIAVVKIINILNHLQSITQKAEQIANTAESIGDFFKYTAGPAAFGKFLSNIFETVQNHRKKGKKDE